MKHIEADFLVEVLSEYFLDEENQIIRNLFIMLKAAGATLILTERAVKELVMHIRAQIFEFESVYARIEGRLNVDLVEYIDRVLIRSYFYARLAPIPGIKAPTGFRSYVENFASYADIKADRGDKELARYLIAKFDFVYETVEEMQEGIDMAEVDALTEVIKTERGGQSRKTDATELLAANDALQVFTIYAKQFKNREGSPANPFGYKTWWLTQDCKVQKAAAAVVARHGGRLFMIRPEFLTNFISFVPSVAQVSASYKTIFPSVLGIKLSNRVANHAFREVVRTANEVWSVDEERAGAIIAEPTEKLKGDTMKIYDVEY